MRIAYGIGAFVIGVLIFVLIKDVRHRYFPELAYADDRYEEGMTAEDATNFILARVSNDGMCDTACHIGTFFTRDVIGHQIMGMHLKQEKWQGVSLCRNFQTYSDVYGKQLSCDVGTHVTTLLYELRALETTGEIITHTWQLYPANATKQTKTIITIVIKYFSPYGKKTNTNAEVEKRTIDMIKRLPVFNISNT